MGVIEDRDDDVELDDDDDLQDDLQQQSSHLTTQDESELLHCIANIGTYNTHHTHHTDLHTYTLFDAKPHCLASLKGVEYLLKHDAPEQQLNHLRCGNWQIVRTHLLPLLIQTHYNIQWNTVHDSEADNNSNERIILTIVKILVRLTMPMNPNAILENPQARVKQHQQLKQFILDSTHCISTILCSAMSGYVAQYIAYVQTYHTVSPDSDDKNMVELYYTLFKNLLLITDPTDMPTELGRAQHDRFVVKLYAACVIDCAAFISQHLQLLRDQQISLLMLDFFAAITRNEQCDDMFDGDVSQNSKMTDVNGADAAAERKHMSDAAIERSKVADRLAQLINADKRKFSTKPTSRHGRFTTMLEMTSKVNGGGEQRRFATLNNANNYVTDLLAHQQGKKPLVEPGKRIYLNYAVKQALCSTVKMMFEKPVIDTDSEKSDSLLYSAKIVSAFTGISTTVFQHLKAGAGSEVALTSDDSDRYLRFVSFMVGCYRCIEYNKLTSVKNSTDMTTLFDMKPIKCVVSLDTVKYCVQRIKQAQEDKPVQWQSISTAALVYAELVILLSHSVQHSVLLHRHEADLIARAILHEQEYSVLLPELIKTYESYRNTRRYLGTLVVAAHHTITLLQRFSASSFKQMTKKRKQTKAVAAAEAEVEDDGESAKVVAATDDATADTESGKVAESIDDTAVDAPDVTPTSAPMTTDELYAKLLGTDADALMNEDADDIFAQVERDMAAAVESSGVTAPPTADAAASVANDVADTPVSDETTAEPAMNDAEKPADNTPAVEDDGNDEKAAKNAAVSAELADTNAAAERVEVDFSFEKFIVKFAHPNIIQNYTYILQHYLTNTSELNTSVADLFLRLCIERKLYTMFYQLHVFVVFETVLKYQHDKAKYVILRNTIRLILRQFFKQLANNKVLMIEILFWKGLQTADSLLGGGYTSQMRRAYQSDQKRRAQSSGEILSEDDSSDEVEMKPNQTNVYRPESELFNADDDYLLATNYEQFKDSESCVTVLSTILNEAHSEAAIELQLIKLGLIDPLFYTLKHQRLAVSAVDGGVTQPKQKRPKKEKVKKPRKQSVPHALDVQYDDDVANGLERADSDVGSDAVDAVNDAVDDNDDVAEQENNSAAANVQRSPRPSPQTAGSKKRLRKAGHTVVGTDDDATTVPVDTVQGSPDNATKKRKTVIADDDEDQMDFNNDGAADAAAAPLELTVDDKLTMTYIEQILKENGEASKKQVRKMLSKQYKVDVKADKQRLNQLMALAAASSLPT